MFILLFFIFIFSSRTVSCRIHNVLTLMKLCGDTGSLKGPINPNQGSLKSADTSSCRLITLHFLFVFVSFFYSPHHGQTESCALSLWWRAEHWLLLRRGNKRKKKNSLFVHITHYFSPSISVLHFFLNFCESWLGFLKYV